MRARAVLLLSIVVALAFPAFGVQRTFVSTAGDNTNTINNCSLAFPCRSFASAMTVTTAGGEIVVLDSGGYGRVTIDKSVAIIAPAGIYAGISVFSPDNGIDIDTPGVIVTLKGLTINGQGGNAGIDFSQGTRLTVENCEIANVGGSSTAGIFARAPGATVVVKNTLIRDTAYVGIWVKQETSGQKTTLIADNTDVHDTSPWGIYVGGFAHLGTAEAYLTHVTVTGSASIGVTADSTTGDATLVSVANSTISNNGVGAYAVGAAAKLVVATSTLVRNVFTALEQFPAATLLSRGDNTIHDNNSGGAQTGGTIGSLAPL